MPPPQYHEKNLSATRKKVVFRMGFFIKIHQNIFWYLIFDIDIKVLTKTHLGQISTRMTCDIQPPKSKVQKQLLGPKMGRKSNHPFQEVNGYIRITQKNMERFEDFEDKLGYAPIFLDKL